MGTQKIPLADKPLIKNLALVVAVVSFVATIYGTFFYQKSCRLEYEVISNTSILNKNVDLSSIRIIVDSIDVQQSKSNISLIELRISNTGKDHLRREDYDNSKFGLKVINGRLLENPELVSASTMHLRQCVTEHYFGDDSTFINIPTLPLDSKDFYQLKLVVLHNNDHSLEFVPYGKIIGQQEIHILDSINVDETFISQLIQGSIFIHLCRLVCYLIVLISFTIAIFSISDFFAERKKKSLLKQAYSNKSIENNVIDDYVKLGDVAFKEMKDYLEMSEKDLYRKFQASISFVNSIRNKKNYEQWHFHTNRANLLKHMLKNGYLKMGDGVINIDKRKRYSVMQFIDFLGANGISLKYYRLNPRIEYELENE